MKKINSCFRWRINAFILREYNVWFINKVCSSWNNNLTFVNSLKPFKHTNNTLLQKLLKPANIYKWSHLRKAATISVSHMAIQVNTDVIYVTVKLSNSYTTDQTVLLKTRNYQSDTMCLLLTLKEPMHINSTSL